MSQDFNYQEALSQCKTMEDITGKDGLVQKIIKDAVEHILGQELEDYISEKNSIDTHDSYELGYGLRKEFWHKGIITEACRAVIEQLKKDGIPYITATYDVNNTSPPYRVELSVVCTGFCGVSKIYFWKAGKKAYRQDQRLFGRTA